MGEARRRRAEFPLYSSSGPVDFMVGAARTFRLRKPSTSARRFGSCAAFGADALGPLTCVSVCSGRRLPAQLCSCFALCSRHPQPRASLPRRLIDRIKGRRDRRDSGWSKQKKKKKKKKKVLALIPLL